MRSVAVIGAGQAGLLIAHALLREGYAVRLFSDKSPQAFLNRARPTGTAARFDSSLQWERALGLNHWEDDAPKGAGAHLTYWPSSPAYPMMTVIGRLTRPFMAIDLRLQSHRWMHDFVARGGSLEIERVSIERLETIAADHDLTIVAAGRGPIQKLFVRDEKRSRYRTPQRQLAMVNVVGVKMGIDGCPFLPVKFNFFAKYGESFWVPWYHKDGGQAWSLVFEAKPGGPFDRFGKVQSGDELLDVAKSVIREMIPQDYSWIREAELADDNAWLRGAFVPEVRKTVGYLPSGRAVMSLGDTNQSLDPIGGQGANNGNKMARNLAECIIARGDQPFDVAWMQGTFERFWERHHWIDRFNNTLLEPLTPAGIRILVAAYGSTGQLDDHSPQQAAANALIDNFNDPALLTAAFHDARLAGDFVERVAGHRLKPLAIGAARLARAQLRMRVGLSAGHPGLG